MTVLEIRGQTGTSRVFIGERIDRLPAHVPAGRAVFITDGNVRRLYPAVFSGVPTIELPAGEEAKSLETVAFIYGKLLELGADRSTFVVGVGGGVVSDLAGFAAATFLRGLGFGYAATTLLAQVDASLCAGCRKCVEHCQFAAVTATDGHAVVDAKLCMGCGVCVDQCGRGAIRLVRAMNKGVPLELDDLMEAAIG